MKQRTAFTQEELDKAAGAIRGLGAYLPLVITVTEGSRLRTEGQNAKYWADMQYFLEQINDMVNRIAEETGYTNFEMRRVIAEELSPEQAAVLFVRTKEAAHEIMKMICNIPTSTRLGMKAFMKFEDRLSQTMTEILGNINAITRKGMA